MDLPRYARSLLTLVTLVALTAGLLTLAVNSARSVRADSGDALPAGAPKLSPAAARKAAHPAIVKAEKLRAIGRFDDAVFCYDDYLRGHPDDINADLDRGLCRFWAGHRRQAIDALSVLIKKNPSFYGAYVHRANMKAGVADYKGALADIEQAIKLMAPDQAESTVACKASILRMSGKPHEALQCLKNELEKGPTKLPALQIEMARVYHHLGMISQADKWYTLSRERGAEARYEIEQANLFATTKAVETSQRLQSIFLRYENALKSGHPLSDSAVVFSVLYSQWYTANDWPRAMRCAQAMLRLTDGAPPWLRNAASVDIQLRQPASALKYLKQIPGYENDPETMELMVIAYQAQGQRSEATEVAQRHIALKPDQLGMRVRLAEIMIDDGRVKQAQDYLLTYESKAKDNLAYWVAVSKCANLLGERALACRALDQCIRVNPKEQDFRISRAGNLLLMEKHEDALVDCNACLNVLPNTSLEYRLRATVLDRLGNVPAALDDYSKAIKHAGAKEAYESYVMRALCQAGRAEWILANKDLSAALKLEQKGSEAYAVFGEANHAMGFQAQSAASRDEAFKSSLRGH